MRKTYQYTLPTVVKAVREETPIIGGRTTESGATMITGPKQWEVVIGPPINLAFALPTQPPFGAGAKARIILEVEIDQ